MTQQMNVAVEAIWELVEIVITEYEERISRFEEETEQQRKRVEAVLSNGVEKTTGLFSFTASEFVFRNQGNGLERPVSRYISQMIGSTARPALHCILHEFV